jgi:RHS repeat-associated protein
VTTYDYYLNPVATTDTSGTSTRTTTTTYDAGERPVTTTITASPAADAGATVPAVTTSYDPDTGLPTGTTTGSGTSAVAITQTFNSLGEQTSYTDADGNTTTSTYDIDGNLHTVNDGKGTYTYTYDGTDAAGNSEHRGLLTKVDTGMTSAAADFAGSTFTAAYDADGNMVREDYPNGLSATWTYDDTGAARALTYATGGDTWLSYAASQNGFGETVAQSSPSSSQKFGYDNAGRLVTTVDDAIDDQGGQACVTRAYTFNKDSDRTSLTTSTPAPENTDGTCPAASSNAIVSDTFDTADRITTNGAYKYDPFGRTRIVPASGLANSGVTTGADPGGDLGVGYYANDMVASQTQGAVSKTFSLDPAMRLRSATDTTTTVPGSSQETRRTLNHYSDGSDSPAWIATSTDAGSTWTWERNVIGIDGNLAALQESDAASVPQLQLTNLHGDIVATVDDTTDAIAPSSTTESTEYGIPRDPNAGEARYGWVGGQRRSADDLAGLVLMGVRLYNPATGRFLSVDPVAGGSANPYAYPTDPVDNSDLSGMFWGGMIRSAVKIAFQVVQYSPGNVGTIANLAKMAADVHGAIKSGNWNKVALDGVDLVAGYVGGKLASRIADKVATTYGEKMAAKKGRHLIKHHGKTTWSQRRVKESVEAMGSTMSTQFAHYIEISSQARVDKASHLYARKGGR